MLRKRMLVVLTVLALSLPVAISAEEAEGGFDFGLNLGIGADSFYIDDTIGYVTYQKLTVAPDIAFGKFGIGLELTLHYTFTDEAGVDPIRVEGDWIPDPALGQNYLDVYLPKFKYIRYGFKGDPLFVKLGSIEDGTLGNGFIMNNYDNTLFLPERRIFGLAFDLDGALFNFPYLGLETFVGNVARFDVLGARLYARPLAGTAGAPAQEPAGGGHLRHGHRSRAARPDAGWTRIWSTLYGADLRQPILASQAISLAAFSDVAVLGNQAPWAAWSASAAGSRGSSCTGPRSAILGRELRAGVLRLHLRPVPRGKVRRPRARPGTTTTAGWPAWASPCSRTCWCSTPAWTVPSGGRDPGRLDRTGRTCTPSSSWARA